MPADDPTLDLAPYAQLERTILMALDLPGRHRVSIATLRHTFAVSTFKRAYALVRYAVDEGLAVFVGDAYVRITEEGSERLAELTASREMAA